MEKTKIEKSDDKQDSVDLNGCKMTCGKFGALWPRPTGYVNLSESLFEVFPDNIALEMQPQEAETNEDKGLNYIRYYHYFLHIHLILPKM